MKKKIQVVITSNKINKYEQGSINNISRGYAFNYLIPNQYAEVPTKKKLEHLNMFNEVKNKKKKIQAQKVKIFQNRVEKIEKISLYKKTGESHLIFGSIGEKDIIKWISLNTNLKLQKNRIKISEHKSAGKITTSVEIKQNTTITLQMNIVPINI